MTRFPIRLLTRTGAAVLAAAALTTATTAAAGTSVSTHAAPAGNPSVSVEQFGTAPSGQKVQRYTLVNGHGMRVRVLTYGGIVQSIEVPDRKGRTADVALGYKTLDDYVADQKNQNTYFGALIGRYANRIAKGTFTLDGKTYHIPVNNNGNALHGGTVGFNQKVWKAAPIKHGGTVGVRLTYVSPDGEMGFPGKLTTTVDYTIDAKNALRIVYDATTTKPTIINLTNHTYFNLAGEGTGDVYDELMQLNAGKYTPTDKLLIPTGAIDTVKGTPLDFTRAYPIGARIRDGFTQLVNAQGYDHNWVIDGGGKRLTEAAKVADPGSGRVLTTYTTEPGVQLYTSNFLDATEVGYSGRMYRQGDAFTLEAQHFPDSPNHPNFPSTVLRPGQRYAQTTIYAFSTY